MNKPTLPLSTDTAAVWGAFLYEGFMMAEHRLGEDTTLLDYWPAGYIELVTTACESLPLLWEEACQQKDFQVDHPGVFEYEVVSELGHYMGNYLVRHDGIMPPNVELVAAIKYLILSFFSRVGLPMIPASKRTD